MTTRAERTRQKKDKAALIAPLKTAIMNVMFREKKAQEVNCDMTLDNERADVLKENTAQAIVHNIEKIENQKSFMKTRWVWELLQNARDASANNVSVDYDGAKLAFNHDGDKFTRKEILRLIYHGSTKTEQDDKIGKYGTGFLTTHLLSPIVEISGRLQEGESFKFSLDRSVKGSSSKVSKIEKSIESAYAELESSVRNENGSTTSRIMGVPLIKRSRRNENSSTRSDTKFLYAISNKESAEVAEEGLRELIKHAPFVLMFNDRFSEIKINFYGVQRVFAKPESPVRLEENIWEISAVESKNGIKKSRTYLVAKNQDASIAVPVEKRQDCLRFLELDDVPKLFLCFPLVETQDFSFPVIVNSVKFKTKDERNVIFLSEENENNKQNKSIIAGACQLLLDLAVLAGKSGWKEAYRLAMIPEVNQGWLGEKGIEWLKKTLKERVVENFEKAEIILNESGFAMSPEKSKIPSAKEEKGVKDLWRLIHGLKEFKGVLPMESEVVGWGKAVESWKNLDAQSQETSFKKLVDVEWLASKVSEVPDVLTLSSKLAEESESAYRWLEEFYRSLKESGLMMDNRNIVPNKKGKMGRIPGLKIDEGISEDLKETADLMSYDVRSKLIDVELSDVIKTTAQGVESLDGEELASLLKAELNKSNQSGDSFAKSIARLFAWFVKLGDFDSLRGFPVMARSGERIALPQSKEQEERSLAPVKTWEAGLRPFAELFPKSKMLDDRFFDAQPDMAEWEKLSELKVVAKEVITSESTKNLDSQFIDDLSKDEKHEYGERIITDVVYHGKVMDLARGSKEKNALFWKFLTEYCMAKRVDLKIQEVECRAEKDVHRYFPSKLLNAVRDNQWICLPKGNHCKADPKRLAELIQTAGTDINDPKVSDLLMAMGMDKMSIVRELVGEENRPKLDNLVSIAAKDPKKIPYLERLSKICEASEDGESMIKKMEGLSERQKSDKRNQKLGGRVEELVKNILENNGFAVTRTGAGSDFKIELGAGDAAQIEPDRGRQSWLVEVKFTSTQETNMTEKQAKTAVDKRDEFLLCVVPSDTHNIGTDEVEDKMKFVENVGTLIKPLHDLFEEIKQKGKGSQTECNGAKLIVEKSSTLFQISQTVWDEKGISIKELAKKLGA